MVAVLGAVSHLAMVVKVAETKVEVALAAVAVVEALTALVEAAVMEAALRLDGVSMALVADHITVELVKIMQEMYNKTTERLLLCTLEIDK
jgi:hypothetical protein